MPQTTPVIQGDGTVIWGSGNAHSTGLIVSGRKLRTADTKTILDNNGFTKSKVWFNHRNECEFEAIVQTAVPEMETGDAITIGGVASCMVDDVEEMWRNNEEAKFRVRATAYDGITPAA
ncbi:hypothetical protein [Cerasicoccus maritimus]|uniref:hypothetical protein n=1 Tax=Cerasicoccus maritimus TaxID=490089 RepID=UPI002852BE4B|nr:hypothetical protein [Cerasicoccus maritimus]